MDFQLVEFPWVEILDSLRSLKKGFDCFGRAGIGIHHRREPDDQWILLSQLGNHFAEQMPTFFKMLANAGIGGLARFVLLLLIVDDRQESSNGEFYQCIAGGVECP